MTATETRGGLLGQLLSEPSRPAWIRNRPNAHWLVVGTVCIGAFMGQLDASIVFLTFPTLQRTFHASLGSVNWVGLSYLLVLVSLVTAVGRIADMVGRKLLYTYGFVVFILGSALCGFAPNLPMLDLFRVLQAIGAAMLQANSVAIIVSAMPADKLGKGIGIQGMAQALGLSLGPAVGGLLIALGGWRLVFFVNVPVGIVGTVLGWYLIPRSRHLTARAPFDWAGLLLFIPAVSSLLLALSFGDQYGFASPLILGLFTATFIFAVPFAWRERSARTPMLDFSIFKVLPFSAGIASGLLSYLVLFGILWIVPFLLETGLHVGPGTAGLEIMVLPLTLGVVAPIAGHLADTIGARPLTVAGMALTALALVLTTFSYHSNTLFLLELALAGAGLGAFTPPNNAAIMGSAPKHQSGMASGVLNMTRGMGTAMGLAVTGLIYGAVVSKNPTGSQVEHGFVIAAIALAIIAALAGAMAAMRGKTALNADPVLTAE